MLKRDLMRCLHVKFGFSSVDGTKHDALSLVLDGRKVATTRLSRGHDEIDDSILAMIARQIGVNLGQLKKMCECTISRDDYVGILKKTGRLE